MSATAALDDFVLKNVGGVPEGLGNIAITDFVACNYVRSQFRANWWAIRLFARAAIYSWLKHLVVDVDKRSRIFRKISAVADHDGHRFADIRDFLVRQRERPDKIERCPGIGMALHAPLPHGRANVVERQDGMNAGGCPGKLGIDRLDCRVSVRAADKAGMQQTGKLDIVNEAGLSLQKGLVLNPAYACPYQSHVVAAGFAL